MSFTSQARQVATEKDCTASWAGAPKGRNFRCSLCGYRFKPGDGFRWVCTSTATFEHQGKRLGVRNLMTCDACDGDDVVQRWIDLHKEYLRDRFWTFHDRN